MAGNLDRMGLTGNVIKGTVAGVIGGIAGSWTMNQFHALLKAMTDHCAEPHILTSQARRPKAKSIGAGDAAVSVRIAEAISRNLFDHPLSRGEKKAAGPAVHYVLGALTGGMYGALAEMSPIVKKAAGLSYGGVLWGLGDEIAVPLLGFAKSPTKCPISTQISEMASHLVFGLTLEWTRRTVRKLL